ncbi:MAG TPA: peptidylprolyl isomerase, partial [Candidatus Polarisedimenticolia bacterium]
VISRSCSTPARRGARVLAVVLISVSPGLARGPLRAAGSHPAPAGDIVARVNGEPISRRDFELSVQIHFAGLRPGAVGLEELRAARQRVLDRLIDNELLYQKARSGAAAMPEADVDAELAKMRERLGKPEEFTRLLQDNGVTEAQFREQLRRSLLVTRFVDREVAAGVAVSDESARRYYDQNPTEMKRRESARFSQIMVRVPVGSTPGQRAESRQRVEAILKELRAGGDFAELARKHSDGPEAAQGGDSGVMVRGGGPPPIERAVFSLAPGEISDIVETRLGYHILKIAERRPDRVLTFDEAKPSITAKLAARERDEKIQEYLLGLRQTARIERLLRDTAPPAKAAPFSKPAPASKPAASSKAAPAPAPEPSATP